LFAVADPHFLEWVGWQAFFGIRERKQKQIQVSAKVNSI
jgi:hypothetical protein